MNYEDRRDMTVQALRLILDEVEGMSRNSFASHANRLVAEVAGRFVELAMEAESGRTADFHAKDSR